MAKCWRLFAGTSNQVTSGDSRELVVSILACHRFVGIGMYVVRYASIFRDYNTEKYSIEMLL